MSSQLRETFFTKPVNLFYMLLGSTLGLSLLGLVMVFSASSIYSLDSKGSSYAVVLRQLIFLVLSIPMAWVFSRFSLTQWKFFESFGFKGNIENRYGIPQLITDRICTKNGDPYDMVHQFNRIPEWNEILTNQYE